MIGDHKTQEFLDISGIFHKQVNIQFSVQHVLDNDDYLMLTSHQKALKYKNNIKNCKSGGKKFKNQLQATPKNSSHDAQKSKKKYGLCKQKQTDPQQQKQTQDNSQTLKISIGKLSPRINTTKKSQKITDSPLPLNSKVDSNKFQLTNKTRSRTKSNCSLHSYRKRSQMHTEGCCGKIVNSNISVGKKDTSNRMAKVRSQTIKEDLQEIKIKNQNIIRNDYFEQAQTITRINGDKKDVIDKGVKKRSTSLSKKNEFNYRKSKKNIILQQKLAHKNTRMVKR